MSNLRKLEVFLEDPGTQPDGDENVDIIATALSMVKGVACVGPLIEPLEPGTDAYHKEKLRELMVIANEHGTRSDRVRGYIQTFSNDDKLTELMAAVILLMEKVKKAADRPIPAVEPDPIHELAKALDDAGVKVTFDPGRNNTVCKHCGAKAYLGQSWANLYPQPRANDCERICDNCWRHWNSFGELP